jgi:adenylate kinase family enzyme
VTGVLAINLWSPQHGLPVGVALLTAFLLGVVHGITPDEHTWPITFSYALGSFSARKGMRSALAFSLAFTAQRALLSELAYLGLLAIRDNATWNAAIYMVVGVVMAAAAFYVLRLRCALHLHLWPPSVGGCHRPQHADTAEWAGRTPTPAMAAVHGFIAGWGMGAFALIMMTVLAPAMPSAALGWAPGAAFGLGTTAVLAGAGAVIGALIRRQRLPRRLAERVAQEGAGWTLLAGGVLFTAAGVAGLAVPSVMTAGISTGIHVHNLDQVNIGTLLVILLVAVAAVTITRTVRRFRHLPASPARLVLLARPGAGQSTQARRLAALLGVTHLSAGELLRQEMTVPSAGARAVAAAAGRGDLAPDDLVEAMLRPRLEQAAAGGGYVLDGFPRDLAQARALAAPGGLEPDVAVALEVSPAECRRRLLAWAREEGRGDDTPATTDRRLAAYDRDMAPVLRYYADAGILVTVDGDGTPAEVTERILARIRPVLRRPGHGPGVTGAETAGGQDPLKLSARLAVRRPRLRRLQLRAGCQLTARRRSSGTFAMSRSSVAAPTAPSSARR